MELDHDVHPIAHRLANLFERLDRLLHLGGGDVQTAILLRRRIEWPDFHRGDAAFQKALRQYIRPIHERVEILEGTLALADVPVRYGSNVARANVAIAGAGVVDAKLVATQPAEHLVYGLLAHLAEDVPQRDVDRRRRAIFRAGGRLR